MGKRIAVLTAGCKANFADSASILRDAAAAGYDLVPPGGPAEVVVVNSCTVTHRADRDSRALARRARREHPRAILIMAGCFARVFPGERAGIPEVDYWIGAGAGRGDGEGNGALASLLRRIGPGPGRGGGDLSDYAADLLLGRRRAFLKIQDGCDASCAYCIVPSARGRSRSMDEEEIVARARRAEAEGAREIVLTGIHIGLFGADAGESDGLGRLLERLLSSTSAVRFRLGSVEPTEITDRLIGLQADHPRVCRHLHVPLQSGCDRTLARMRRPYDAGRYAEIVSRAASRVPGMQIGADVIAGFPGETASDFEETLRVVASLPLHYLHVFPYSARAGTESARWPDDVTPPEKKQRVSRLLALDRRLRNLFLEGQAGSVLAVLAEDRDGERGEILGRADNYAEVAFPGRAESLGEIVRVRVDGVRGKILAGAPA